MIARKGVDWLATLREIGALTQGHFELSSGLHSDAYVQCARLLERPDRTVQAAVDLVAALESEITAPNVVVSPAMGAVVLGYEVARRWGCRSLWAERTRIDSGLAFRRGFSLRGGDRVVIVEDVVTTAGSARELMDLCHEAEAKVVGAAAIVDRSMDDLDWDVPFVSLIRIQPRQWRADACPLCREGRSLTKPGSRPREGTNRTP